LKSKATSLHLFKYRARIETSMMNFKQSSHLVQKPQSIYCCIWNIFSICHIIYFHTFLTRHFLGRNIDRYICQFNFMQTKQKNFWHGLLYCLWSSVTIMWKGYYLRMPEAQQFLPKCGTTDYTAEFIFFLIYTFLFSILIEPIIQCIWGRGAYFAIIKPILAHSGNSCILC